MSETRVYTDSSGQANTRRARKALFLWKSWTDADSGAQFAAVLGSTKTARNHAAERGRGLERDELWFDRHPALTFCLSMIFPENRIPLFRIML
jgi:hypothetical protein